MKVRFEIKDDGSLPVVYVDDAQLSVTSLTYAWQTRTDQAVGTNMCIVDGYFGESTVLRRFLFDIITGIATEASLADAEGMQGRVFEVCTDPGTSPETEVWVKTPFKELKNGDIIRIIDAGKYYTALDGCNVWVVIDTVDVEMGLINVQQYDRFGEGQL